MDKSQPDFARSEQRCCFQATKPKIPGSKAFRKYEEYKLSKTISEAKQLGMNKKDFFWDLSSGFLVRLPDDDSVPDARQPSVSTCSKEDAAMRLETGKASKTIAAKRRRIRLKYDQLSSEQRDVDQPMRVCQDSEPLCSMVPEVFLQEVRLSLHQMLPALVGLQA